MALDIQKFEVGPFAENTYLLTHQNQSVLIDPGFSNERELKAFQSAMNDQNSKLLAVLLTHAHIDHVLGLPDVLNMYEVDVYLSHKDLYLWEHIPDQAAMFGLKADKFVFTPKKLLIQKGFTLGPFTMDLLYTPGHAPDHVSIYFSDENSLIAGDTLFSGSVGRTDLYKGDMNLLTNSIYEKIYSLPDQTVVYPGHGPKTSVGKEKRSNPFVKG